MPAVFPIGTWAIGDPLPQIDPYEAPFFIPTDAHALINEWTIIQYDGTEYGEQTDNRVMDWGYGLHFSSSRSTLGCLKIENKDDLLYLVSNINDAHKSGEIVQLVVGG